MTMKLRMETDTPQRLTRWTLTLHDSDLYLLDELPDMIHADPEIAQTIEDVLYFLGDLARAFRKHYEKKGKP